MTDPVDSEQEVEDVTLALFKLLVAIFEHSYPTIVTELSTPRSIALLQRLLLLTCFPGFHDADEQVSDLGLPIWAYIQEEIADNGVVATTSGLGDPRWPIVKEVFDALVNGLRLKVAYPGEREYKSWPKGECLDVEVRFYCTVSRSDFDCTLTADIKQSFSRYRIDVGDCLINAYYVLRDAMLADLVQAARSELQPVAEDAHSVESLEATLFCIAAVHEAVPMDEDTALTQLFSGQLLDTVTKVTGTRYHRLQRTALEVIGEQPRQ